MKEVKKEQFEVILQKISCNNNLIEKLVIYLENNNLMEDFYGKMYYIIEKDEPIYKIRYYKDEDGKIFNLYDIKNLDILINKLERCLDYVYDENEILCFAGYEINKTSFRYRENSKSYNNLATKFIPLNSYVNLEQLNLVNFIKSNPLLFVYATIIYNIDLNKMDEIDAKSYTYKREIKNN